MHVILYAQSNAGTERWVHRILELGPEGWAERYERKEEFVRRLKQPLPIDTVVVAVFSDREDLMDAQGMRELIREAPSVLVLPDRSPSILSMGFGLYPRFVEYLDGNPEALVAVLPGVGGNGRRQEGMWKVRPDSREVETRESDAGRKFPWTQTEGGTR